MSRSTSKSVVHVQPLTAVATARTEEACEAVVEEVPTVVQVAKAVVGFRRMEVAVAFPPVVEEEAV